MFITILDFAVLYDVELFLMEGSSTIMGNTITTHAHENMDVEGSNIENRFIIMFILFS